MPEQDRYGGFLSAGDLDHLREWDETTDMGDNEIRQYRFDLRQRAARALRDLAILQRELPDGSDRGLIYKTTTDPKLWQGYSEKFDNQEWDQGPLTSPIQEILKLLFVGFDDSQPNDIGEWAEQWVRSALREVFPDSYVRADIRFIKPDRLDTLEQQVRAGGDLTDHGLNHRDLAALVETGRLTLEEYIEAGGTGFSPA